MGTGRRRARAAEIAGVVEAFESGAMARDAFDHGARLTVALWYMTRMDEPEATACFLEGERRLEDGRDAGGRPAYHETIALFWLAVTRAFLRGRRASVPITSLVDEFVRRYGSRASLVQAYYSPGLVASWRARHAWVEPDLRPLDF